MRAPAGRAQAACGARAGLSLFVSSCPATRVGCVGVFTRRGAVLRSGHARGHLRRRRDRGGGGIFPEPARRRGHGGRAHRRRLRGLGQVGRLSGAGLVRRHGPGGAGAAELRAACRTRGRTGRRGLGLSPDDDLRRPCRRAGRRTRRAAALALGRGDGEPPARHARDHRAGASRRLHRGDDAGGGRRRRDAAAGPGHGPGSGRRAGRRRRGGRRVRRGRRRGRGAGAVVDPGVALAGAAGGLRPQGPQPGVRDRRERAGGGGLPGVRGGSRRDAGARAVPARRRHHLCLRDLQREPASPRPRRGRAGRGRDRAAGGDVPAHFAGAGAGEHRGAPGLPPPGDAGRAAADRARRRARWRLCRHRPQRLVAS